MGFTVSIRPAGSTWQVVGRDLAPGIVPQGLRCTADQWGPAECTFTLARDPRVPWGDLVPFTDVDVHADSAGLVWSGRIWSTTPAARGTIAVTCRGWQYLLDDDLLLRSYVRHGTTGFTDIRNSAAGALNYAVFDPSPDILASNDGSIRLQLPARALLAGLTAAVMLDVGSADARSVSIDYVNLTGANASITLNIQGYDDAQATVGGINLGGTPVATTGIGASPVSGDFASSKRYVLIGLQASVGVTPAAVVGIRITGVRIFGQTAYRSGSTSILKASDVVLDMRTALATWLDSDTSAITTTATNIDALGTDRRYETPRQILQRANAYHDYLMGVDALRRLYFRPRPTEPLIQIGDASGATWADAGDSAEELYNRVIVSGLQPDGSVQNQVLTATSPLLSLNGYTRTRELTTQVPLTSAAATVIGNAFLARRKDRPTRGQVVLAGPGSATKVVGGAVVVPAEVLRYPGELVRIGNRWSPDDGGNSRDGVISQVAWDADTDTTAITVDSPRADMEVVLARYAALQAARPQNY